MTPTARAQRQQEQRRQQACRAMLLLLLLLPEASTAAAAPASPATAHTISDEAAADAKVVDMLRWLRAGGAVVNIEPGLSPAGVRGAVAASDIPAGGLIASVPLRMAIQFPPPADAEDLLNAAASMAREALNQSSPYAPYLASLPSLNADGAAHTLSYESFPAAYLHLLQDGGELAAHIVARRAATGAYWAVRGPALLRDGVTLDRLRAAVLTLTTRYFNGPGRAVMAPVYDLLNHVNGCGTYATSEPCPQRDDGSGSGFSSSSSSSNSSSSSGNNKNSIGGKNSEECIAIRTRGAVPRGAEVCNTYGWLAPDHAAFHYGFLPAEAERAAVQAEAAGKLQGGSGGSGAAPPRPELSRVDRRGFRRADLARSERAPAPPFAGSSEEMAEEAARLERVLAALAAFEPLAAAQQVDAAEDPDGSKLALIQAWRRQRAAALRAEIVRLKEAAAAAAAAATAAV